jgi:hypothetical protein
MPTTSTVIARALSTGHSPEIAEAIAVGVDAVLEDLHAQLFPEQHPGYDPYHRFWDGKTEEQRVSFAARKTRAAELWAPVAKLYRSGDIAAGDRAAAAARPELDTLGDLREFKWNTETAEMLAARIERLRAELRP